MTSDRRFLSFRAWMLYKDNVCVETSVIMNCCAIFRCTTNTGHHRGIYIYYTIPYELSVFETYMYLTSERNVVYH